MEHKEFVISTEGKPYLERLMMQNPQAAKSVIQTFVALMEDAVQHKWHELPQLFGQGKVKLDFRDLIAGVLHGSLDLPEINPDLYDVWKEEVHPLSMIAPRKDFLTGGTRYFDWRRHYRLESDAQLNQETIATIFRRLLRYYKYVDVETMAQALQNNQSVSWRGLENPNLLANLPFVPALRYQKAIGGDLHVGKFFDEVGFYDCGSWLDGDSVDCPACSRPDVIKVGKYHVCQSCNAGFKEEVL